MTSNDRRAQIKERFYEVFGYSYARGVDRLETLIKRSINFDRFVPTTSVDYSRISISEKDFALITFFAYVGTGHLEELGIPPLPAKEPETLVDVEYKEGDDG